MSDQQRDSHQASSVPLPPMPISECPETTSKVIRVRGLPFAVNRFQIRQFFRAFQIEEDEPVQRSANVSFHSDAAPTTVEASPDAVLSPHCGEHEPHSHTITSVKMLSCDSLTGDNGESLAASTEESDVSKHTTPSATTPRGQLHAQPPQQQPHPRWSTLAGVDTSAIVWFPSGTHHGEGFIRLKCSEDVVKAVELLDRNHFADRIVEVTASSEEERQACVADFKAHMEAANKALVLRLRGLPFNAEEDDVRAFIRSVEGVISLDLCRDATGRNTGDAFIELESEANVAQAKQLHEKMMGRRYIEILPSSAHDRLCVLRAAARRTGFAHPHASGRHGARPPRGVNNRHDGSHGMLYDAAGLAQDTASVARPYKGGQRGGARAGYGNPSYGGFTHRAYQQPWMYYAPQSFAPMDGSGPRATLEPMAETDSSMNPCAYDANYGYYYGSCGYAGRSDMYACNAPSGVWYSESDSYSTEDTYARTHTAALPHGTGKTHNPYGYSAIDTTTAESWQA